MKMKSEFGMEACMESVKMSVELLGDDPFTELGRAIIRAEQDICFNKTMIDAWKQYIRDNNITWRRD